MSQSSSSRFSTLVERHKTLSDWILQMKADLKARQEELRKLEEYTLPELMEEEDLTAAEVDGAKLTYRLRPYGSLPREPAEREAAIEKVVESGEGDLISNTISVKYAKSQREEALGVLDTLHEINVPAELTEFIHPQSYLAWVRRQFDAGTLGDPDALGVYIRRHVEIKHAKSN